MNEKVLDERVTTFLRTEKSHTHPSKIITIAVNDVKRNKNDAKKAIIVGI